MYVYVSAQTVHAEPRYNSVWYGQQGRFAAEKGARCDIALASTVFGIVNGAFVCEVHI